MISNEINQDNKVISSTNKCKRAKISDIKPRIYKCSFKGCDKAYINLKHLNNHSIKTGHGLIKRRYDFK